MSIEVKKARAFKVGQMVRIVGFSIQGVERIPLGSVCKVYTERAEVVGVYIPDESDWWPYPVSSLAPADAPAPRRPTVGDRVQVRLDSENVLTYTVTEEADERLILTPTPRQPRAGEVWRDEDGDLMLVGDEFDDAAPKLRVTMYVTGQAGIVGLCDPDDGDVFAYESLSAAITAGAIN